MWHLENEFSHLSHFKGTFFEAVKIVVGQDEETFFPPEIEIQEDHLLIMNHLA